MEWERNPNSPSCLHVPDLTLYFQHKKMIFSNIYFLSVELDLKFSCQMLKKEMSERLGTAVLDMLLSATLPRDRTWPPGDVAG